MYSQSDHQNYQPLSYNEYGYDRNTNLSKQVLNKIQKSSTTFSSLSPSSSSISPLEQTENQQNTSYSIQLTSVHNKNELQGCGKVQKIPNIDYISTIKNENFSRKTDLNGEIDENGKRMINLTNSQVMSQVY